MSRIRRFHRKEGDGLMKQNQLATFSALPEDNGLKARYEKYRSLLKEFTLMNDVLMRNVFKERACTEYVLQIIMGKKDLKVKNQVIQQDYKNLQGRSAILTAWQWTQRAGTTI